MDTKVDYYFKWFATIGFIGGAIFSLVAYFFSNPFDQFLCLGMFGFFGMSCCWLPDIWEKQR